MLNNNKASFFNKDRESKYYWGMYRLAFWLVFAHLIAPMLSGIVCDFRSIHASRYMGHIFLGIIGAIVNVQVTIRQVNLLLLLLAGLFMISDFRYDFSMLVYGIKTFGGDFLAGKLDTLEWKLVLVFMFVICGPVSLVVNWENLEPFTKYLRIGFLLFIIQLICEYGDNHWESYSFFRYRYSFELLNAAVMVALSLQLHELRLVQYDLLVCLFYRITNFSIICIENGTFSSSLNMILFRLLSLRTGVRTVNIRDPDIAVLVMKQSVVKGSGLEKFIANPAWLPIVSLESVDEDEWKIMRKDFDTLLPHCTNIAKLQEITSRQVTKLIRSRVVIDSHCLCKLTVEIFILYLFDKEWCNEFQIIVDASMEWRKEIAVRAKGNIQLKSQAIEFVVESLLAPSKELWPIFGDKWRQARYFSLIMQPFLISPAINVCDIFSAVRKFGPDCALEDAMRKCHPFPIFERFVTSDVVHNDQLMVAKNTQVVMMTADFNYFDSAWPVFGCGARSCAGMHIALPFLRLLRTALMADHFIDDVTGEVLAHRRAVTDVAWISADQFQPQLNHKYSGRTNDGKATVLETIYFVSRVAHILWTGTA